MENRINESIEKFIKENKESSVVKQLIKANEDKDRKAFIQLIGEIRKTIAIQGQIEYHENEIEYLRKEWFELP